MKKILLIVFTLYGVLVQGQTFVSTTPENKNVILEEFTGISCGFCPDGHSIANSIHASNPNDVAIIAIHAGGFASPQGPGTDFRTTEGNAIDAYWNITGYPTGTVNRDGGTMSRGDWATAANQILTQSSPVNIATQASVDMSTNVLTVDVEVYYTGNQNVTSNQLHVAVVQNNVEGPQSGSASNPSAVLANGNYNHKWMLRYLMTGTWGETITSINSGDFYSTQYTWNIPNNINGVTVDGTNLGVIAFVSEDNEMILNGTTEVSPSLVFAYQNDAYCMSSQANDAVCATTTDIEVTFRNFGSDPLTSLDINYSINGGNISTYNWTGNLASAGTETITIPSVPFSAQANNTVNITTSNPNGLTDPNTSNDQTTSTFSQFSSAGQVASGVIPGTANIDIICDAWGGETTWEIKDDFGNIVASGGPYQSTQTAGTYPQPTAYATLNQDECYSFIIKDSYGDGMSGSQYGYGSFTVTDSDGNIIISGGAFQSEYRESFKADGSVLNISEDLDKNYYSIFPNPAKDILTINGLFNKANIVDIYGRTVVSSYDKNINISSLANGVYILNIINNEGVFSKRITISK